VYVDVDSQGRNVTTQEPTGQQRMLGNYEK